MYCNIYPYLYYYSVLQDPMNMEREEAIDRRQRILCILHHTSLASVLDNREIDAEEE